jgi:hypothetical protein
MQSSIPFRYLFFIFVQIFTPKKKTCQDRQILIFPIHCVTFLKNYMNFFLMSYELVTNSFGDVCKI